MRYEFSEPNQRFFEIADPSEQIAVNREIRQEEAAADWRSGILPIS